MMNLARRILEGIHEVELEITPEFLEPEKKISFVEFNKVFENNGWKIDKTFQHGTVITYVYAHPRIPGAAAHVNFSLATNEMADKMMLDSGPGSEPIWLGTKPVNVSNITKDWLAIQAKAKEDKGYQVWVGHPKWATVSKDKLVKHGGSNQTLADAVERAEAWLAVTTGPGNKSKSQAFKKGYFWVIKDSDGNVVRTGGGGKGAAW